MHSKIYCYPPVLQQYKFNFYCQVRPIQYKSREYEALQNRSNVNKGIGAFQKPDMFFAYNNGITTTAQARF